MLESDIWAQLEQRLDRSSTSSLIIDTAPGASGLALRRSCYCAVKHVFCTLAPRSGRVEPAGLVVWFELTRNSRGTDVGVQIEPVTAVLRVGDELLEFGDPYEFSATVIIRGRRAEIVGASGRFELRWRREIERALAKWGVTEVVFERKVAHERTVILRSRRHDPVAESMAVAD